MNRVRNMVTGMAAWVLDLLQAWMGLEDPEKPETKIKEINWKTTILKWGLPVTAVACFLAFMVGWLISDAFVGKWLALIAFAVVGLLGLQNIPVGFEASLLLVGQRTNYVLKEGGHWTLPILLSKSDDRDVREQTKVLDPLQVFTSDQVPVKIKGTIVWVVENVFKYLSISQSVIDNGLDEIWDEVIRIITAGVKIDEVLGKDFIPNASALLVQRAQERAESWGIKVKKVVISEIVLDPAVAEDLSRVRREIAQREAEKIQGDTVAEVMKTIDPDSKMDPRERLEGALLSMKIVTKTLTRTETGQDAASLAAYERIIAAAAQAVKDAVEASSGSSPEALRTKLEMTRVLATAITEAADKAFAPKS